MTPSSAPAAHAADRLILPEISGRGYGRLPRCAPLRALSARRAASIVVGMRRIIVVGFLAIALLCCGACASRGREVFAENGCGQCHRFRGEGGGAGPDLTDVASRKDAAAIRAQITSPAVANPASRMPAYERLSWFELRSLVAYLRS